MADALRAVIYVPADSPNTNRWTLRAIEYVEHHRYELDSIVHDWDNISAMLATRDVDVIVALRRDHPPADRVPRLEYVEDEEEGPAPASPRGRRPRLTGD